jgi:hypothetical protein
LDAGLLGLEQLRLLLGPWSLDRAAASGTIVDAWLLGFGRRRVRLRPGYWGQRVGFYGGIDYGFGYSGAGYQGGRWDNGRFFYNTTMNNIGAAHIANVYNQPVVANATTNRASFNGGAGGVVAKPTNEELLAEKEQHVRATKPQTDQARAAGMRSEQFVSTAGQASNCGDRAPRRI